MAIVLTNNISKKYQNEYIDWRDNKNLQDAKRQEYFRQNPDAIKDKDLQRAKILLYTVDMMDKSVSVNSDHTNTIVDSITSMGLGYAAVVGATLGLLFQRMKFVQNGINKITIQHPKSRNIVSNAITTISGVLGVVAAYPVYSFFSNLESKIDRKKRFDTMEKELQDPRIFASLDDSQKIEFEKNLANLKKNDKTKNSNNVVKKSVKSLNTMIYELRNYDNEQKGFRQKYEEDKSYYEKALFPSEIKNAKKDKVLLCVLIKEMNTKAQSYEEKMQKFTDNFITFSFAIGSLLTLGYERLAKAFKFKSSALPSSMGIVLMLLSTVFATWAQNRAAHIGRFKAKQELMRNPERLVYVSKQKTNTIDDSDIQIAEQKNLSTWDFLKEFFKSNKEYEAWKKTPSLSGKELSKAMERISLTQEQLDNATRLKTNIFKTFYKVDSNTNSNSSKVDVARESIKYPIMLILGSLGSLLGAKHILKLRGAHSPKEVFAESAKYIGTISVFTLPTLLINSYFAKIKKMSARISDMATMKELEDYRFFADYSRFKEKSTLVQ